MLILFCTGLLNMHFTSVASHSCTKEQLSSFRFEMLKIVLNDAVCSDASELK